ncbi:MAG: exodeoxyribonuclease VII small subunit [Oscillospiraceae bacterium]|nr:exodeoxyribonuclease VII small subunit [Oscillospiraceae bacterium]MBQ8979215.1 exodeoxyribonuclease VII small subunit [Oscillospiraceae bacterium]
MTFDETMKSVEETIKQLSAGDIPLEKAVELYKKGMEELTACNEKLTAARSELLKITDADAKE